ncbi:MAG TPA: hypothetical protein VGQ39_04095 [Pyrinomonadaceae bacterium]|nr:hypothetical protein [Pyrinomonadaceae bacterium]
MRNKSSVSSIVLVSLFVLASVSVFIAQTRPPARANDFRVKYRVTFGGASGQGQTSESVTMIKGARERSEQHSGYGYDSVNITQCDLKRTIQISDRAKKYIITPMETGEPSAPRAPGSPAPASTTPTRQGGTVEYVTSAIDTGERRQMFGFTARHVKSSIAINAAPDSCNPGNRRNELDGWYIDLSVEFNCELNRQPTIPTSRMPSGGCKDQVKFRREGNAKTGYPLIETVKVYGDNGQLMFSQTKEVVELSRESLDIALFDIPAGYTEAASTSELYGAPSIASIMSGMTQGQTNTAMPGAPTSPSNSASQKKPGSLLIGVVQFNNKANRPISLDALRQRLVGQIANAGFDAIPLNATSQMEAEAEAKVKECDFILYTDIATLKMNKLGGMLGSITGVQGAGKTEAKLEFKLFAVGESTPRLQSNASAKEEGDENSAGTAVDAEARLVVAEVRKRGRG